MCLSRVGCVCVFRPYHPALEEGPERTERIDGIFYLKKPLKILYGGGGHCGLRRWFTVEKSCLELPGLFAAIEDIQATSTGLSYELSEGNCTPGDSCHLEQRRFLVGAISL